MPSIWKRRSELNERRTTTLELRRATPAARGYDAAWNRVARARRTADHWLCQPCLREGRLTSSNEVDHILPIHVRPDWRLEFDNTQVICRCCHRRKTIDDAKRYGSSEAEQISPMQQRTRLDAKYLIMPPRRDR